MISKVGRKIALLSVLGATVGTPAISLAFGDEGHRVAALVARTQMTPAAIAAADRLVAVDTSSFKMTFSD